MNWSTSFQSSTDPQKQRLYRENAPNHVKDTFISCNLSHDLRSELDTRSFNLRTGDRVEVMRGDRSGAAGIVNRIDRDDEKVYIDGIETQKVNGTSVQKPFHASNLQIVALNLDDPSRVEDYGVDELEEVRVSEEEVEEALEEDEEGDMMQQMQTGESSIAPDSQSKETQSEETEDENTADNEQEAERDQIDNDVSREIDYEAVVDGTIAEAKEKLEDAEEVDYDKLLKAEQENKDRKTLKEWAEAQKE